MTDSKQEGAPQVSPQGAYADTRDFRDSGMMGGPGAAETGTDTAPGTGAQDTSHITPGEPLTGDTRTMTTPGSSKTDDSASQGHRIAGDDNRQ